jgi:hypothetical protein
VTAPPYKSDRWVTPGVVVALILAVLVALLAVVGAAAWLTAIGKDPGPMFDFVTGAAGALTGSASLLLQMANRKTATKTERNTGVLASAVYEVADAMPRPVPRHAYDDRVSA